MPTPTYIPLATKTLTANAASVTFSSISQAYRDLVLVCSVKSSDPNDRVLWINFNGDVGANYNQVYMQDNTGSAATSNAINQWIGIGGGTAFLPCQVSIIDSSATDKHKSSLGVYQSLNVARRYASRWANTSAITSITLTLSGPTNIASGSTFALYGIVSA